MHPYFLATGPAFKAGYNTTQPFTNLDIFPLMCHLLGVETCPPNNGSFDRVKQLLKPEWLPKTIDDQWFVEYENGLEPLMRAYGRVFDKLPGSHPGYGNGTFLVLIFMSLQPGYNFRSLD